MKLQQHSYKIYAHTLKINMNRFSKFCKESIPVFGFFVLIIVMAIIVFWLTSRPDTCSQSCRRNFCFCLVVLWTFVAICLSFSGLVIFLNLRAKLTTSMVTIKTSGDQEKSYCRSGRVLDKI